MFGVRDKTSTKELCFCEQPILDAYAVSPRTN